MHESLPSPSDSGEHCYCGAVMSAAVVISVLPGTILQSSDYSCITAKRQSVLFEKQTLKRMTEILNIKVSLNYYFPHSKAVKQLNDLND